MAPKHSTCSTNDKTGYTINDTYYLGKILGSGASGTVYLSKHIYSNQNVAIKIIAKPSSHSQQYRPSSSKCIFATPVSLKHNMYSDLKHLYNEVLLHSRIQAHPNVLSLIEVLDASDYICVVLEYCPIGDLFSAITEKNWYVGDERMVKALFVQLLDAVEYCHNNSIFHCDLKPENIMVTDNGHRVKIADFGLASSSPICNAFGRGSSYYMAPETIAENIIYRKRRSSDEVSRSPQSKGYPRAASDVWALGILLLNLIFGRNPWKKASVNEDSAYRNYSMDYNTMRSILPVSEKLNRILALVFHPDPYRRISIQRLRQKILACENLTSNNVKFSWFVPKKEQPTVTPPSPRNSIDQYTLQTQLKKSKDVFDVTYVHIDQKVKNTVEVVVNSSSSSNSRPNGNSTSPTLSPNESVSSASSFEFELFRKKQVVPNHQSIAGMAST